MTKEQMKEIMREAKQDAEDKIYDDAIDGMERQFEKMKVSTSEENTITTILKMHINVNAAFGSYIEEIINNRWSCLNNEEKKCVVQYFAEIPQHYSYIEALFDSMKLPLLHKCVNEAIENDEPGYEDFITRYEFINKTGIFVSPMQFHLTYNKFIESKVSVDKFVSNYEAKYATCIEEIPLSGTFKYEVTDIELFESEDDSNASNIWEIINHLATAYDHKAKYADEMTEKYHNAVDEILEEIRGYLSATESESKKLS